MQGTVLDYDGLFPCFTGKGWYEAIEEESNCRYERRCRQFSSCSAFKAAGL